MLTRSIAKLQICSPGALSSSLTSRCHLFEVPPELLHRIFSFLSLSDFGQLCFTSHALRARTLDYVLSPASISYLTSSQVEENDCEVRSKAWLDLCRNFGIFCKRANMTELPRERVAEAFASFVKLEERGCAGLEADWAEVQSRAGLAAALHSLTLGWHDLELRGVMKALVEKFSELRLLYNPTLAVNISLLEAKSSELRCVLRTFIWDFPSDESSQATWLAFILREFSSKQHLTMQQSVRKLQAILLVFMLGSTRWLDHKDFKQSTLARLRWTPDQRMLQDQPFVQSYAQAKLSFGDLGKALRILEAHRESAELGVSLYSLMEAVFQDWDIDNSAACLLFSSEQVVAKFLSGLLRDGGQALEEVAKMMVALLTVCEALGNNVNEGLVKIIDFTFSVLPRTEKEKRLLISLFWRELVERLEFGDLQVG